MRSLGLISKDDFIFSFGEIIENKSSLQNKFGYEQNLVCFSSVMEMCGGQQTPICVKMGRQTIETKMLVSIMHFQEMLDIIESYMSSNLKIKFSKKRLGGVLHILDERACLKRKITASLEYLKNVMDKKDECGTNAALGLFFAKKIAREFPKPNWLMWSQSRIHRLCLHDHVVRKTCREEIISLKAGHRVLIWTWLYHHVGGIKGYIVHSVDLKELTNEMTVNMFGTWTSSFKTYVAIICKKMCYTVGFKKPVFKFMEVTKNCNILQKMMESWSNVSAHELIKCFHKDLLKPKSPGDRGFSLIDSVSPFDFECFIKSMYVFETDNSPRIHCFDPTKQSQEGGILITLTKEKEIIIGFYDMEWISSDKDRLFITCCVHSVIKIDNIRIDINNLQLNDLNWNNLRHEVSVKKAIVPFKNNNDNASVVSCIKTIHRRRSSVYGELNIALPFSRLQRSKLTEQVGLYDYSDLFDIDTVSCLPLNLQIDWINMMVPCSCKHDTRNQQIEILKIGNIDVHITLSDKFSFEGEGSFLFCMNDLVQPYCEDIYSFPDMIKNHIFSNSRKDFIKSIESLRERHGGWDEHVFMECESRHVQSMAKILGIGDTLLKRILPYIPNVINPDPRVKISPKFKSKVTFQKEPNGDLTLSTSEWNIRIEISQANVIHIIYSIQESWLEKDLLKLYIDEYASVGIWECDSQFIFETTNGTANHDHGIDASPIRFNVVSFMDGEIIKFIL